MTRFVTVNRDTVYLLPPSVEEWLPKDHLARFVVDIIDELELSELTWKYRGAGSAAYHPAMMLGFLVYARVCAEEYQPAAQGSAITTGARMSVHSLKPGKSVSAGSQPPFFGIAVSSFSGRSER